MPSSDQVATESLLCSVGAFFTFWFSWLGVRWVIVRHKDARMRRILTRTHVHVRLHRGLLLFVIVVVVAAAAVVVVVVVVFVVVVVAVAVVVWFVVVVCLWGLFWGLFWALFFVVVVVVVNVVAVSFPKQGIIHLRRNNIIQS